MEFSCEDNERTMRRAIRRYPHLSEDLRQRITFYTPFFIGLMNLGYGTEYQRELQSEAYREIREEGRRLLIGNIPPESVGARTFLDRRHITELNRVLDNTNTDMNEGWLMMSPSLLFVDGPALARAYYNIIHCYLYGRRPTRPRRVRRVSDE